MKANSSGLLSMRAPEGLEVKHPPSQCLDVFFPLHLHYRARVSKQLMISVALLSCRCYIHPSASGSSVFRILRRIGHYLPHSISSLVCTTTLQTFVACPETRSLVLRAATFENAVGSANENLWLPSRHNCFHHFLPHRTLCCFLYLAANIPSLKMTQIHLHSQH